MGLGSQSKRNHQFDLLRIIFATMVLLSHAPEITDGDRSRELFHRFTHTPLTFGMIGVDGFFLLSGYLIVKSWMSFPRLSDFMCKRVLRIIPGYAVAVLLSTLAVGLLAPGEEHFFRHLNSYFIKSVVLLEDPSTPPVFPGQAYPYVNGALYTIAYEFRCYLLVAIVGALGILRMRTVWLVATVCTLAAFGCSGWLLQGIHWPSRVVGVFGDPHLDLRLTAVFLVGGCFYLFRDRISFRPAFSVIAALAMVAVFTFLSRNAEVSLVLCGGYLLFYLGRMHLSWLSAMSRVPDISYGIYLYGWPVESLWIWFHKGSPWITFLVSTVLCLGLGWLSWTFVELPALSLKRKTAATPGLRSDALGALATK